MGLVFQRESFHNLAERSSWTALTCDRLLEPARPRPTPKPEAFAAPPLNIAASFSVLFIPLLGIQLYALLGDALTSLMGTIAFDKFDFAVRPTELLHLLKCWVHLKVRLDTLFQVVVNFLIVAISVSQQSLS